MLIRFYFLSPSNKTQTIKLLQTNRMKNVATIFFVLQPEGQKTVVLYMVDLHQSFI